MTGRVALVSVSTKWRAPRSVLSTFERRNQRPARGQGLGLSSSMRKASSAEESYGSPSRPSADQYLPTQRPSLRPSTQTTLPEMRRTSESGDGPTLISV